MKALRHSTAIKETEFTGIPHHYPRHSMPSVNMINTGQ
jgi:hypothetical protein